MFSRLCLIAATALFALQVTAHTVITYPGWRGDNLITNDTFPYGMQWMYPCGGMPTTTNRTLWPINGGAIALQPAFIPYPSPSSFTHSLHLPSPPPLTPLSHPPGWFQGHATAFFYINLGFGTDGPSGGPPNMSFPMVPVFQIVGPSKNPYPGSFCLPQVPLPANTTVKAGDNATIQVVEVAVHGASLFSCVDITFAAPENVPEVNETNCFNSTDIAFNNVYSIGAADSTSRAPALAIERSVLLPLVGILAFMLL
ncbi:hypothetical protein LCER1_G000034 [Lachnellula cervina]|uniref:Copper acquisition factor BIM1-like domain-containing protein n=1 Tax=Lachnellula cervina TaxID=1316786 RepID=A0A7D8YTW6_9HELO|nr:hypothetical protein LCER1_G000034 [Lachnellula cervina]